MEQIFLRCKHCGNIVQVVEDSGVGIMCCGERMQKLIPGTVEASTEKHIPVFTVDGNKVTVSVGSVNHPMQQDHYIQWISLQTKMGNQRVDLSPESEPKVCFTICDGDEVEAVYAYCNLHGLWKAE